MNQVNVKGAYSILDSNYFLVSGSSTFIKYKQTLYSGSTAVTVISEQISQLR